MESDKVELTWMDLDYPISVHDKINWCRPKLQRWLLPEALGASNEIDFLSR